MYTLYDIFVYLFSAIILYTTLIRVFKFIFSRVLNMADSGVVKTLDKLNDSTANFFNNIIVPFDRDVLDRLFKGFLVVSVFLMMFLIIFPIILRKVAPDLYSHFTWSFPFVQHLVFLCVFVAGALATGSEKNICIDIVSKVLENRKMFELLNKIKRLTNYVCLAGVMWLTKSGLDFLMQNIDYARPVFLGIKDSYLFAIMPIGFALISYKFLILILKSFYSPVEEH